MPFFPSTGLELNHAAFSFSFRERLSVAIASPRLSGIVAVKGEEYYGVVILDIGEAEDIVSHVEDWHFSDPDIAFAVQSGVAPSPAVADRVFERVVDFQMIYPVRVGRANVQLWNALGVEDDF